MKIKRFTAPTMTAGMKLIGEALGPEAVILSNKKIQGGLEIVAGVDESEYERFVAAQAAMPPSTQQAAALESDIIKANPGREPQLDVNTMQHLLSSLSEKAHSAFSEVGGRSLTASTNRHVASAPRTPKAKRPAQVMKEAWYDGEEPTAFPKQPKAPADAAVDEQTLKMIRDEIIGLKALLKEQTEQLREPMPAVTPQYERLEARLIALGFTSSVVRKLMAQYDKDDSVDQNWRKIMGRLASAIPAPLYDPIAMGGVFALNGPTGAGKTTTIAKLAAHAVKDFGAEQVAIVSLDWYQVGGQDILKSVAHILGIEFHALSEEDSLLAKLKRLDDKKIVFIDTSGSQEAMLQWNRLMGQSSLNRLIQTLLVLPATMHPAATSQFIQHYTEAKFDAVILTKLDESSAFGGVLEPVLKHRWPVWYCTDGQNIPRDIELCQVKPLVQRLVRSLTREPITVAAAS